MKGLTITSKTNNTAAKTAGRAAIADLQTLAAQGVERALAARGLTELNAEQVEAVSGGATTPVLIRGPIINGILNPEILKAAQLAQISQPQLNTAVLTSSVIAR